MKINSRATPFNIAIISAFTVANSLILAPFYKKSIIPLLLALVIWVAVISVFTVLQNRAILKVKNKTAIKIISILIALAAVAVSGLAFREHTDFIYNAVLIRADMWVIKAVFALCVYFLAISDKAAIYKFSLLTTVLASAVFIVLFFLSAKTFETRNLRGIFSTTGFSFAKTADYFVKMFLPTVVCVMFIGSNDKKLSLFSAISGTIYSIVLCLLVIFDSVLSFGLPFSAELSYPYISDISTVTIGSLFTRMDGFAYFSFFACYIVKCGVCINLSATLISEKYKKTLCLILCAILTIFL